MPVLLQEQDPLTQPELAAGGSGAVPPTETLIAVAAPEPPEKPEAFNPDQVDLKAETDANFNAIVQAEEAITQAETDKTFAEMTAQNLGDVAAQGAVIVEQLDNKQN